MMIFTHFYVGRLAMLRRESGSISDDVHSSG
jgi:hypothetical protein